MAAGVTARGRAGRIAAAPREHPGWLYLLTVPGLCAAVAVLALRLGGHFLDLEVYRLGVHTWLAGGDPYGVLPVTSAGVVLPFIYPPFAALVMVPLTVTGWSVAATALFVASLLSLALTLYLVVRALWPRGGHSGALLATSALVPVCLQLEPVSETFAFGQINLVLMVMVALDCLIARTRWPRGLLVGLAAAVKLTPAAFVLYFLLRRDYRAALTTLITAVLATAIGAAVEPAPPLRYWGGGLAGAGGVSGSPFFTNQTFQAVLVRAGVSGLEMKAIWLLASAALLLLATPAIRRAPRPQALVCTAGVALLTSPTSWSHHWVWIAPALLVTSLSAWRARSWPWALASAVLAATFVVAPFHQLPHDDGRELAWTAGQQVIGASYVIVTVAVYVLVWLTWRRRRVPGGPVLVAHPPGEDGANPADQAPVGAEVSPTRHAAG